MNISARNQFAGKVVEIKEGVVTAKIVIETAGSNRITSMISLDSVKDLDIKIGSEVTSVIKSTSVMLATK